MRRCWSRIKSTAINFTFLHTLWYLDAEIAKVYGRETSVRMHLLQEVVYAMVRANRFSFRPYSKLPSDYPTMFRSPARRTCCCQ